MRKMTPLTRDENIIDYAKELAFSLFDGVKRDTGLSYFEDHLKTVASIFEYVTIDSKYRNSGIAASWLHDSAEDIKWLDVLNPFDKSERLRLKDMTYLNDLLKAAGEESEAACFMIDLLTHRKGIYYQDYIYNIFNVPSGFEKKELYLLTEIIKIADRRSNINPEEQKNVNGQVKEYLSLEESDEETLVEFYKKTKTIDAFRIKGSMDINAGLFAETLRNIFRSKQRATAIDNLAQYLPLAERKLLVETDDDNGLFDRAKLREVLKQTYINSLRLYPGTIHEIKRLGINRTAPEIPGYVPILKEIRGDWLNGDIILE